MPSQASLATGLITEEALLTKAVIAKVKAVKGKGLDACLQVLLCSITRSRQIQKQPKVGWVFDT